MVTMMKIAVCEPNAAFAGKIEEIILDAKKLLTELDCEVYMSGEDFERALLDGEVFSIVYMDLDMGDTDGVTLGRKLRETHGARETPLIYLSSKEGFPEQIFEVQPFLVLRLPPDNYDFQKKLYMAVENLNQADSFFTLKKGGTTYQIKKRDVICLESAGRDVVVYAVNREEITYRAAIKNEAEKLKAINFVRPHQSFVINLDYVEEYHSENIVLSNKMSVPISELRMKETKKAVLRFWEYRNKH